MTKPRNQGTVIRIGQTAGDQNPILPILRTRVADGHAVLVRDPANPYGMPAVVDLDAAGGGPATEIDETGGPTTLAIGAIPVQSVMVRQAAASVVGLTGSAGKVVGWNALGQLAAIAAVFAVTSSDGVYPGDECESTALSTSWIGASYA